MPLTLLSYWFRIYRKKCVYFNGNSEQPLENLKTSHDSALGRDISIHVNKSPINLVTQSL
jgi:hypothetical protein